MHQQCAQAKAHDEIKVQSQLAVTDEKEHAYASDLKGFVETSTDQTCSNSEILSLQCPFGTTCCRPPTMTSSPICCPGSGSVSCCGGGFCCPENYHCDAVTLKCVGNDKDLPTIRAHLGFIPNF